MHYVCIVFAVISLRLCNSSGKVFIQNYDDDGETAAGKRLLHLLQVIFVQPHVNISELALRADDGRQECSGCRQSMVSEDTGLHTKIN